MSDYIISVDVATTNTKVVIITNPYGTFSGTWINSMRGLERKHKIKKILFDKKGKFTIPI